MEGKECHKSYSFAFKLKVIDFAEKHGKHKASKLFYIDRKRVREWCQNKEKLQEGLKCRRRLAGGGRSVRFLDIDEELEMWIKERRSKGVRITGKSLRQQALMLHKEKGNQSFKASSGWFTSFKKRHNITFRRSTHVSQKPVEIVNDKVDKFLKYVIRMRKIRNYPLHAIGNMDETPVWLEMPGKSTLDTIGMKEIRMGSTGHEKQKITVTLSAYADGTKMAPLVHLPGSRPLPKKDIPSGIVVYMCGSGKKSWADEESIKFWLQKLWGQNNTQRRFLVWDSFRGHLTPSVKKILNQKYNSDMCVIPGGCTSRLQPADVSWNRPFKAKIAELYDEWLFTGPIDTTKSGNRRAPSKPLLLQWIKIAWGIISPEIIIKSFKKCGITNSIDGNEDHLFQASDEEDPFDGFDADDVQHTEAVYSNIRPNSDINNLEISEISDNNDSDDASNSDTDYDSPGH